MHWVHRLDADARFHGPNFGSERTPAGEPLLLLRNVRATSTGAAESRILQRASPGVYDLDDGLPWDDGRLPGHERWQARLFPRSRIARRAAAAADRVIAGNDVLADWASGHNADVRVVPTCVEPEDYTIRTSWEISGRPPRLGWIGSPATERFLEDIAPALAGLHRRTGARISVVSGHGPLPRSLTDFADKIAWRPGVERLIADWDVGLMPLRDGLYERAKCGYKLLQYAASGVPAVGSPVGVNRSMLVGMDGLGPTTVDEWSEALLAIVTEPSERRAARATAGLHVAEQYSYSAWESEFRDAVGWDGA